MVYRSGVDQKERIAEFAAFYDVYLKEKGHDSVRADLNQDALFTAVPIEIALPHARWMCGQIPGLLAEGDLSTAERYLGFVKGIMWVAGVWKAGVNLMWDEEARHSRSKA